jgi:hypothetical protein
MNYRILAQIDFTLDLIYEIIDYKKTNLFPTFIKSVEQAQDFKKHFGDAEVRKDKLFFENREVIPNVPSQIREVLTEVYNSPEALGKGQNALHKYIETKYIGINRAEVKAFLKKQIPYQLGFAQPRVVNRGIVTSAPFQTWSYDLVDVSALEHVKANKHFTFILSILDLFLDIAGLFR